MRRIIILVLVGLVTVGSVMSVMTVMSVELVNGPNRPNCLNRQNPYQEEYEKMLYPTVRISSPSGVGSGVMIDVTRVTKGYNSYKGYILTAAHVVENQNTVNIELYNSTVITASVVITDTAKDLALLGISHSSLDIYVARLAPKDYTPYIFTPIYTVGCSLGLPPRPSQGIVTSVGSAVGSVNGHNGLNGHNSPNRYWEVSSPILPGNSGGPVYDAKTYEVIGIAVWVRVYQGQLVTTMAGIVPIQTIYEFLDNISHQDTKTPRIK